MDTNITIYIDGLGEITASRYAFNTLASALYDSFYFQKDHGRVVLAQESHDFAEDIARALYDNV